MKLYVLRHGEAVEPEVVGGIDEARTLTPEGAEKIRKAAVAMGRMKIEPEFIWTSPVLRAWQTAKLVHDALPMAQMLVLDELRPGAEPDTLCDLIQNRGGASLLIVGHNPDLEILIQHLLKASTLGSVTLKKGGMALLRVERPVGRGTGNLMQMWTPKILTNLAG